VSTPTPPPVPDLPAPRGGTLTGLVRGVRPGQWTKNVLVFAAPVAAGDITNAGILADTAAAFAVFCAAAGGTYLLNDARDADADRQHPTKRLRPVASGQVSPAAAYATGVVLVGLAVATGFVVAVPLGITVTAYLVLTTLYSFGLKRVPVVDLVAVAAGFVLRAVAGAAATGLPLSEWFFIVTSAGALLLITAKREAELAHHHRSSADPTERPTREVLASYTPGFLASVRTLAGALMLIAYCLWAFEGAPDSGGTTTGSGPGTVWLQASVVPFAVVVLRYLLLADAGAAERPERLVFSDRVVLSAGAVWAIIYGYGVYVA